MTKPAQWTSLDLDIDGRRLHAFERGGSPSLDPVVLLHGAGGNARTWAGVAPAFADRPLLLVDMPGHGRSARPATWDLDAVAADLARAIHGHLGRQRALWGGHSWGGKVAGLIAAAHPSRTPGLLLFDPSPSAAVPIDVEEFVDGIWQVELAAFSSEDEAVQAARDLRHWQPWTEETAAVVRHGLRRCDDGTWTLAPTREDLIDAATATLHVDATETLAGAAGIPALLLIAEESRPWQAVTNVLAYPTATQVEIPGNHWIHQCDPDAVGRAISAWFNSI